MVASSSLRLVSALRSTFGRGGTGPSSGGRRKQSSLHVVASVTPGPEGESVVPARHRERDEGDDPLTPLKAASTMTVMKARHLVCALVVLASACRDGSDSPEPAAEPEKPSPNATITFDGSRGVGGRVADPDVRCNWPDLEGQSIALLARLSEAGSLARIQVWPDH